MTETDLELLQRYTHDRAEDAFAEIVTRHVDLVYSAAFRMVGDGHAAKVTQSVFVALAQNARQLTEPGFIAPYWSYDSIAGLKNSYYAIAYQRMRVK